MAEPREMSGAENGGDEMPETLADQEQLEAINTLPSRLAGANQPQHLNEDESLLVVDDKARNVKTDS